MLLLSSDIEQWKEPICFYAHQSVENTFKALIASHRRPPRLQDLEALLEFARVFGYTLGGVDRRCRRLNKLVDRGRYPSNQPSGFRLHTRMSPKETVLAIEDARAIREAVERELARPSRSSTRPGSTLRID
jgi:HEPN domain-containing protein